MRIFITPPSRPRGQVPGSKGHGRTARPLLPVVEEMRTLPPEAQACPCCRLPFAPFPGTEDSEIVEIQVGAYVRKVKRVRYRKTCQCPDVPGVIAAPPAPRLIPKCDQGVSVWVEVLLGQIPLLHPHQPPVRGLAKPGRTRRTGDGRQVHPVTQTAHPQIRLTGHRATDLDLLQSHLLDLP